MSQSVSISFGLAVTTIIVVTSIFISISFTTQEMIQDAEDKENDRTFDYIHTQIDLLNASLDSSQQEIYLLVKNTGSESIFNIEKIDIFTNATINNDCGPYVSDYWIPSNNLGTSVIGAGCYWSYQILDDNSYNPSFWDPNEIINISITFNVSISQQNYFYRVSTPNSVGDSSIFNTIT